MHSVPNVAPPIAATALEIELVAIAAVLTTATPAAATSEFFRRSFI
jgi:hypothetical protein